MLVGPRSAQGFLSDMLERLARRHGDNVELLLALQGARLSDHPRWAEVNIVVPMFTSVDEHDIAKAGRLAAIVVPTLGYDRIDVAAASRHGVVVANSQTLENPRSVAEAAMMFMLMALYQVRAAERRLCDQQVRPDPPTATMVRGKTIGLIGFGQIARELEAILRPWGVRILCNRRSTGMALPAGIEDCTLDELLASSDVIIPLVPATTDTIHLLDRQKLCSVRDGAVLINLSRGAVIDETALAEPAIADRFRCIALDVYTVEPLPFDSPLRRLTNTILTPHDIAHTIENIEALKRAAIANIDAVLACRCPEGEINCDQIARKE
jgi:glyoxylate/hydroxypyruvate/2-ketogluconate reductase